MPTHVRGPIPAGIWKLNTVSSQLLAPKTMTLWIIQNTADELKWVAVETNAEHQTAIHSWQGRYGGEASVVAGAGIKARLTSTVTEGIRTEGEFPGIGRFVEFCRLSDDGRRMICEGEVSTDRGPQTYREEFDWFSDSPHALSVTAR
jgi:hypothetical protein